MLNFSTLINKRKIILDKEYRILLMLILFIILAWIYTPPLITWIFGNEKYKENFGNQFEALNALFSGFAFGGILITLFQQRIALKNQQKELDESLLMFKQQNFETTYFNLVSFQKDQLSNIWLKITNTRRVNGEIEKEIEIVTGERALYEFKRSINDNYISKSVIQSNFNEEIFLDQLNIFFSVGYNLNFSAYMNSLFYFIWYISENKNIDPTNYIKMFATQLSWIEKYFIFHYLISTEYERFEWNKYNLSLIEGIPFKLFLNDIHYEYYVKKHDEIRADIKGNV